MPTFISRLKADPLTQLSAVFSFVVGLLFIVQQGGRLLHWNAIGPDALTALIGEFDQGFLWADILLPGPLLLVGALCLLGGLYRLGHLLVFAGWTINLYDMIVFYAGYGGLGQAPTGALRNEIFLTGLIALLCMVWSAIRTGRK